MNDKNFGSSSGAPNTIIDCLPKSSVCAAGACTNFMLA
jgi:hypothetical protein